MKRVQFSVTYPNRFVHPLQRRLVETTPISRADHHTGAMPVKRLDGFTDDKIGPIEKEPDDDPRSNVRNALPPSTEYL